MYGHVVRSVGQLKIPPRACLYVVYEKFETYNILCVDIRGNLCHNVRMIRTTNVINIHSNM
jgi:hypothetical protein